MPSLTPKLECDGRRCHKCGKCRDHGVRAGARKGVVVGVLSVGALAGVSVFLVAILGPLGSTGLVFAIGGAAISTVGGAGTGAALGAVGAEFCEAGICRPTTVLQKRLINLASKIRPQTHLQPILRPPPTLQTLFPRKDPIPNYLQSHIVYNVKCNDCKASYIGKTIRQVVRRFHEHGAPREQLIPTPLTSPTSTTNFQTNLSPYELRRSTRNKNKHINYFPKETTPHETETIFNSALHDHAREFNHTINWKNWKIVSKDSRPYRLLIKESLAIQQQQPELNKTMSSAPLIVYPDGLDGFKPKVKMKQYKRHHGGEQ